MLRVQNLRQQMAACAVADVATNEIRPRVSSGVQAFLIGTEDAHQSEYVGAHDKRRQWISNFTGSAGTALVTHREALLWTDGRYFLQAADELHPEWTLMKAETPGVPTYMTWLSENLKAGDRIGIDPKLTSVATARSIEEQLKDTGISLVNCCVEKNLIDLIWEDQPLPAATPVTLLDPKYTGTNVAAQLDKFRKICANSKADGIVLTALDDIAWFFGIRGSDVDFNPVCLSYAFITQEKATLFINSDRIAKEARESLEEHVDFKPYEDVFTELRRYVAENPLKKVLLDPSQSNLATFNVFPKEMRIEQPSAIVKEKTIKNEVEKEGMRQAHIRDGAALVKFFCWLDKQMREGKESDLTEFSVAEKEASFRQEVDGFVSLSFETISSVGKNGAVIHYSPSKDSCAKMDRNKMYLNDSGGQYVDGTTDVTRTVHFGTPTKHEKNCFTHVLKAHIALATAVFPEGTEGVKLDSITRLPLWKAGLDYRHGTGHGVGAFLNVHERGVLLSSKLNPLGLGIRSGMVLSNEPGYYEDGNFGIRIESVMIAKKANGIENFACFETITMTPIQRSLLQLDLLTSEEINWLNDYHKEVREKLTPLLEHTFAFEYLVKETEPISAA